MGGSEAYGKFPPIYASPERPRNMTDELGESEGSGQGGNARDGQHMESGTLDSTNRGRNIPQHHRILCIPSHIY